MKDEKKKEKKDIREKSQQKTRIAWARSLTNNEICSVLQNKLLESRASYPRKYEIYLIEELAHEIKHRLSEYTRMNGDLPQKENEDEQD